MLKSVSLAFVFLISISTLLTSQECTFYFPTQTETVLEYHHFDARNRLVSVSRKKVVKSEKTKDGYQVTVHKEVFDNQDNLIFEDIVVMKCIGGEFLVDMSCYFHNLNLATFEGKEIVIESDTLTIPKDPKPGLLPSFVTSRISVLEEDLPVKHMVVNVYFRIVEGYEDVTTPAGTFHSLKMNYEVETIVNQKVKSKGKEWFSVEAGLVKRETYDSAGRIIERIVLASFKTLN